MGGHALNDEGVALLLFVWKFKCCGCTVVAVSTFKERFSLGFEVCWGVVLTFPFFFSPVSVFVQVLGFVQWCVPLF